MSEYDTEEYISKVMKLERCSRDDALKLIEDFKNIDGQSESTIDHNAEKRQARYNKRRDEKRCIQCGKQDTCTLLGGARCNYCRERARISTLYYYQRKRKGKGN